MPRHTRKFSTAPFEKKYDVLPKAAPVEPLPEALDALRRVKNQCQGPRNWNVLPIIKTVQDIIQAAEQQYPGIKKMYVQGESFHLQIVPFPFPWMEITVQKAEEQFHDFFKRVITLTMTLDGKEIVLRVGSNGYPISVSYQGHEFIAIEGIGAKKIILQPQEKTYILRYSNRMNELLASNYKPAAVRGKDLYGKTIQQLTQR